MSDTHLLLTKIAVLRQRLEQAQGLARETGTELATLAHEDRDGAARLRHLQRRVMSGGQQRVFLDDSLRQLTDTAGLSREAKLLPTQLTSRARRVLEIGRKLLHRLQKLAEHLAPASERGAAEAQGPRFSADADPLALLYRETAAMTDAALRMVQAFPDAASAQLRLCEGLEGFLGVIAQRIGVITVAQQQRQRDEERIDKLARAFMSLHQGQTPDIKVFVSLGEELIAEAKQAMPLRFAAAALKESDAACEIQARTIARFIACHSLTVAQVMARVVRHESELRNRQLEAVLAALVHDAGMLAVPADAWLHDQPLDDAQRRAVERHCHAGALLAKRLFPSGAWLAEATAGHHERIDGTGYPDGLRELQIPPLTRLLAVCDVYVALCGPRLHRPAKDSRTALADTLLLAEQGALDRQQAERLLELSFYPVGSVVELADGEIGLVVATHEGRRDLNTPARPVLALLADRRGTPFAAPRFVDLAQCEGRSIVRTLSPNERREKLGKRYPELVC